MKDNSTDISGKLIRSSRRTLALEINQNAELVIRAPFFMSKGEIFNFLEKHKLWIEKKKNKILAKREHYKPKEFREGEVFLFLGQEFKLQFVDSQRSAVSLDYYLNVSKARLNNIRNVIENWYREEARTLLQDRIYHYSDLMGLKHRKLRITSAQSRWGSCSHDDNLNFPWRLVMAPLEIIDYVVVHELAHIKQKNHSKKFWAIVEDYVPDYKSKRKWLRENGEKFTL